MHKGNCLLLIYSCEVAFKGTFLAVIPGILMLEFVCRSSKAPCKSVLSVIYDIQCWESKRNYKLLMI